MSNEPPQPPGWYPTPDGKQRYWDGTAWTEHMAPAVGAPITTAPFSTASQPGSAQGAAPNNDERSMAAIAHVLGLFAAILGPLIIYMLKKDESPYVRHQSAEALNFGITMAIFLAVYTTVSVILVFVVIGIFMLFLIPVVAVGIAVFHVLAALAANRGESYEYPFTIRFVS